jgi:cellulose synthase/poly-beta-1,6-N-acetylglucosamine synthase-like glycosyltransferase
LVAEDHLSFIPFACHVFGNEEKAVDGSRGRKRKRLSARIRHLVILPMYDEPYSVVRESFAHLAQSNYPKKDTFVVLATEARAGEQAQDR